LVERTTSSAEPGTPMSQLAVSDQLVSVPLAPVHVIVAARATGAASRQRMAAKSSVRL